MASFVMRPNGDVDAGWAIVGGGGSRWAAVDDAVTEPTAGDTADGITSSTNAAAQNLDLTAPTDVATASAATIWIYASTATDEDISVALFKADGVTQVGTTATHNVGTSYDWWSHPITGLSLTQADIDGLRLRVTAVKVGGGAMTAVNVAAAYVDLTYTVAAAILAVTAAPAPAQGEAVALTGQARLAITAAAAPAQAEAANLAVPRRALVSWARLETPAATTRRAVISWARLEATGVPEPDWLSVTWWKLVYGDGTVFTSDSGSWANAPATGVQILRIDHNAPYTTYTYGVDTYALPGETTTKAGSTISDEAFAALVALHVEGA